VGGDDVWRWSRKNDGGKVIMMALHTFHKNGGDAGDGQEIMMATMLLRTANGEGSITMAL
jgi:hypothetical protein